jgi:signal transduction histidine kinase
VPQSWISILRNLTDHFLSEEQQRLLIREIDQRVIRGNLDINDLVKHVSEKLMLNTHASVYSTYLYSGINSENIFMLYCASDEDFPEVIKGEQCNKLRKLFDSRKIRPALAETYGDILGKRELGESSVLTIPIRYPDPFGVILLFSPLPAKQSHFAMPDILDHANMVKDQLGIVLQIISERQFALLINSFIDKVLKENIKPSVCLNYLVNRISSFIPSYGPLKIDPAPKAQILFYRSPDSYLTIKASQGSEPFNTRVSLDNSICGLLIEKVREDSDGPPFICVDPHDYPERYQWFLGSEEASAPHSELAVAILSDGQPIAVLNLEHPKKDVFLRQHIEGLIKAANSLEPFVRALQERTSREWAKEQSLLSAVQQMLGRLAGQFQHRVGTPLISCRLELENLEDDPRFAEDIVKTRLNTLKEGIDRIDDSSQQFCRALPEFLVLDRYDLGKVLGEVLDYFHPDKLRQQENIDIRLNCPPSVYVYCSGFIREHLYNLVDNALYSIREAKADGLRSEGIISVQVTIEEIRSKQIDGYEELPPGTKTCYVTVSDNGKGVSDSMKDKIGKAGFTTKGPHGTGYGLSAAVEYVQSIGGDLTWKSEPNTFFEATMRLDVFDESIHKTQSVI